MLGILVFVYISSVNNYFNLSPDPLPDLTLIFFLFHTAIVFHLNLVDEQELYCLVLISFKCLKIAVENGVLLMVVLL